MNTAAFIHGKQDIRIGEVSAPAVSTGSVLVDIASVGVCGSDLHYYKDGGIGSAVIREPFVPGHEFSGHLSVDVPELDLQRGQLVAVDPASPCHQCEWCQRGYHNLCPHVIFLGSPPNQGALTQSLAVPVESLVPLPDNITADQAAMLEPLGVCIHIIDLAKPRLGESVAVLGCGPIGLGVVQLLAQCPVRSVLAIDPQPHRAELAAQLGASHSVSAAGSVRDHEDGLGCDLVIECTNSPAGMIDAVSAARIGGRVIMAGIPDGDQYDGLSAAEARRRGLDIRFSRRMGTVYPRAVELVRSRRVDVDAMISHRFELPDTAAAFEMQAAEQAGHIKSIVYPRGLP